MAIVDTKILTTFDLYAIEILFHKFSFQILEITIKKRIKMLFEWISTCIFLKVWFDFVDSGLEAVFVYIVNMLILPN